jgi:hypothetical protein
VTGERKPADVRPVIFSMTISRAELEAVPPTPDLVEQHYRALQAQLAHDMERRPSPQIVADFETLNAEAKLEADFMAGKPIALSDGRTLIRSPTDPDKAYVLPKPASLSELLRDFPITRRKIG